VPAPEELSARVQAGVDEVRRSNAIGLAWLRLAVRSATLLIYLRYVLGTPDRQSGHQLPAVYINVAHLAVGAAVLVLLLRRKHLKEAILAGALSDLAVTTIAVWRNQGGPYAEAGLTFFMAIFQADLLFAALTLGTRTVAAMSAFALAAMVWQVSNLPVWDSAGWLILAYFTVFAVAVTFAGTRMVGLASRHAAEEYGASLLRTHAAELAASNAALHEARARSELLTRLVVHDLRSPLSAVLAGLDEAREAVAPAAARDPELADSIEVARSEGRRLVGMISDLVAIGKLEQGLRAERADADVAALLREVARAHEPQALRQGVTISVVAPPVLRAEVDAGLVRRSLENLLANALRHVGRGDRIQLAVEPAGGGVRLAARNTGPPVAPALRGRIFEKDVSGARGDWGRAGLGLHLCRLAAEAHGGRIALVERDGWNVSFELELPGADGAASASLAG
jgi:signal transduction histidine kinase